MVKMMGHGGSDKWSHVCWFRPANTQGSKGGLARKSEDRVMRLPRMNWMRAAFINRDLSTASLIEVLRKPYLEMKWKHK